MKKQRYSKPNTEQKKKLNVPLVSMFLANSGGLSSKRICGILGWMVCLILFTWAFIANKQVPEFGDLVVIMSSSLLGIDSVTQVFQKRINK